MSNPLEPRDSTCIFCRIVAGEIPANQLWSGDNLIAFHDLAPQAPVHILIVPTRHIADASAIEDQDGELLAQMFRAAQAIAQQTQIDRSGYRLIFNVGDDAGNTVPHLHLHLLGGRAMDWPPG